MTHKSFQKPTLPAVGTVQLLGQHIEILRTTHERAAGTAHTGVLARNASFAGADCTISLHAVTGHGTLALRPTSSA